MDDQIKLRGQRVEPAEIEQIILKSSSNILECLVMKQEQGSEEFLTAYLAIKNHHLVDLNVVKKACSNELPQFKCPSFYVILPDEKLPRNANGKINRAALPPPSMVSFEVVNNGIQTPLEIQVQKLWLEVLQRNSNEQLVHDSSWSDVGGTSISIVRLITRYRKDILPSSHQSLTFSDFLRFSTIRDHARLLTKILNDNIQESKPPLRATGTMEGMEIFIL